MLILLLAYLGGVLTILSPCILPVLPFVFARADRAFLTNGLPLLGVTVRLGPAHTALDTPLRQTPTGSRRDRWRES